MCLCVTSCTSHSLTDYKQIWHVGSVATNTVTMTIQVIVNDFVT